MDPHPSLGPLNLTHRLREGAGINPYIKNQSCQVFSVTIKININRSSMFSAHISMGGLADPWDTDSPQSGDAETQ